MFQNLFYWEIEYKSIESNQKNQSKHHNKYNWSLKFSNAFCEFNNRFTKNWNIKKIGIIEVVT